MKLTAQDGSYKVSQQMSIAMSFNLGLKAAGDTAAAQFCYATGVPFSIIGYKYLKIS